MKIKPIITIALLILIFVVNFSCLDIHNKPASTNEEITVSNKTINNEEILSQFKEIDFDSFWVYPDSIGDAPNYKFKGKPLARKYYSLFKNILLPPVGLVDSVLSTSFRFPIGKKKLGLICETAGLDGSFAGVNLYIWDKNQNKITQGFILADNIGDAGGGYEYISTLYRKSMDIIEIKRKETTYQPTERDDAGEVTFIYKYSTSYWLITEKGIKEKK